MNKQPFEIYLNNRKYIIYGLVATIGIVLFNYKLISMDDPKWGATIALIILIIFNGVGLFSLGYLINVIRQKKPKFILTETYLECNTGRSIQNIGWNEIDKISLTEVKDSGYFNFSIVSEEKKFKLEIDTRFLKISKEEIKEVFKNYGGEDLWNL